MVYKIALDLEGTIADIHTTFSKKIIESYRVNFSVEDINAWNWGEKVKSLGLSIQDCLDIRKNIWLQELESIPFTDETVRETIYVLTKKYKVDIVTAIEKEAEDSARNWLSHNSINHLNLVFHNDKEELDYDLFIDDKPSLASKLPYDKLIVYDRPWNRYLNSQRVYQLEEVVKKIDEQEI